VQNVVTGGSASTTALAGSTEAEQFHDLAAIRQQPQPTFGTSSAND